MKFKEFVKRTKKYLNVIRDIGKDEIYRGKSSFDVIQNTIDSNNNILARTYTDHHIVISYYSITNLSKQLILKRNDSNFKRITHDLLDPVAYRHLNETEFINNLLIEICIHELLHMSQYINPLYSLNKVKGTNGKFTYSREKYMKYIEVPNRYRTTCFIADHKEELYKRLGYLPFSNLEDEMCGYLIYADLLHSSKNKNISKEEIRTEFKNKLKNACIDIHGNFIPYRKSSIDHHIAMILILDLKKELENLTVQEMKSRWMKLYKAARRKVIDYRNSDDYKEYEANKSNK